MITSDEYMRNQSVKKHDHFGNEVGNNLIAVVNNAVYFYKIYRWNLTQFSTFPKTP